jgi:hypothetical protein
MAEVCSSRQMSSQPYRKTVPKLQAAMHVLALGTATTSNPAMSQ